MIIVVILIDRGLGFASTHGYEHDARDRAFIVVANTHYFQILLHLNIVLPPVLLH